MKRNVSLAMFFTLTFLLGTSLAKGEGTKKGPWQRVTWTTNDGIQLVGLYRPATKAVARTWILLHGLGSHKYEWQDFANQMAAQGSGVFIYDARGHEESTHTLKGESVDYKTWQSAGPGSPWAAMPADLASAVRLLHRKYALPESNIAVGGASLGANVALVYASEHARVPAIILLSPGMEYAGITAAPAYKAYQGRPVFIAASPGDDYAYATVRQLSELAPGPAQSVVTGSGGHGVQMFKDEAFRKKLLDWIKTTETTKVVPGS